MGKTSTIGPDIAKQVLHAHGADASGAVLFSRRLTRQKLIQFSRVAAALHGSDGGLRRSASPGRAAAHGA